MVGLLGTLRFSGHHQHARGQDRCLGEPCNVTFGDLLVVVIFVGSVPFASQNDSNFAVKIELDPT